MKFYVLNEFSSSYIQKTHRRVVEVVNTTKVAWKKVRKNNKKNKEEKKAKGRISSLRMNLHTKRECICVNRVWKENCKLFLFCVAFNTLHRYIELCGSNTFEQEKKKEKHKKFKIKYKQNTFKGAVMLNNSWVQDHNEQSLCFFCI